MLLGAVTYCLTVDPLEEAPDQLTLVLFPPIVPSVDKVDVKSDLLLSLATGAHRVLLRADIGQSYAILYGVLKAVVCPPIVQSLNSFFDLADCSQWLDHD